MGVQRRMKMGTNPGIPLQWYDSGLHKFIDLQYSYIKGKENNDGRCAK